MEDRTILIIQTTSILLQSPTIQILHTEQAPILTAVPEGVSCRWGEQLRRRGTSKT